MASIMNTLFGGNEQIPLGYTQEQQSAINDALGQWRSGMANPSAGFEPIANQARKGFQERTLPNLMQRLTNMGGGPSGSFGLVGAQAGRDLESDLAAQQAQYGLKNQGQMMDLLKLGLTKQYSDKFQPGLLQSYAKGQLEGMGKGGGGLSDFLSSFGKPQDKEKDTWVNLLGSIGSAALTGGGVAGPWGAAGGAILPLIMRLLGK